jgi:signal transduction histidine kinase
MFRKLRNKILTLNVAAICAVLVVSFAAVYILTLQSFTEITVDLTSGSGQWLVASEPALAGVASPSAAEVGRATVRDEFLHVSGGVTALNVSAADRALNILLLKLVSVGAVVIAAVILISYLFANRALRPVREAWDRQRRFIAYASHELKTPLMTVSANLDALLEHEDETVGSQRKWIEYAYVGVARMERLISGLLVLAGAGPGDEAAKADVPRKNPRVKSRGASLEDPAETDLSAVIDEEFALLGTRAERKGLRVARGRDPGRDDGGGEAEGGSHPRSAVPASVSEDARRIIATLLDNAVKYADAGGEVGFFVETRPGGGRGEEIVVTVDRKSVV